jgi:hypothetical protein
VTALLRLLPLVLLFSACASAQYPDIDDPLPPGVKTTADSPPPDVAPASAVITAAGGLQRADVERVVDAGLGSFLGHVSLEPSLTAGKFNGWNIVALQPPELWRGVDLKPGDVVTRVNGMPIEREGQAYDAFQAVRQAGALEVSYVRHGQTRLLRYPILGKPSPSLPKAPPTPAPASVSSSQTP